MTSPVRARRTQVQRRRESERALLIAAAAAIAERGVNGASFAVIGDRAGTSRALPTHHFGSKDALVALVASTAQDAVLAAMTEAIESERRLRDLSGLEVVRTLVNTYLGLFEHPTAQLRALIVMWGSTFPSDASIEGMLDADQRAFEGWAGNIRDGQADGSIRSDVDADASAVVLHGLLRGVAALVLTEAKYTDMSRVRVTLDHWITGALAPTALIPDTPGIRLGSSREGGDVGNRSGRRQSRTGRR
jgi:AcrR family transcriptional regulator